MTGGGPRGGLPPGAVVVVAGPDGSGKTSLAHALVTATGPDQVVWLHHRPRLLPSRGGSVDEPVTDPYGRQPYPPLLSVAKVVYYWLDYVLGWGLRVRPALRRGGAVVLERGWWDLAADPRRYRLQRVGAAVSLLGRLLPRPTATFVLTGPVELLLQRTGDNLTADDVRGQVNRYRQAFTNDGGAVFLDVRQSLHELQAQVVAALEAPADLAGLPRPAQPRWLVPRRPAAVAAGALRIQHPKSTSTHVVWCAAAVAARAGALRLFPAADPAAVPDLAAVRPWIPAGGGVAVARSNHAGRHHLLVVDHRGTAVAHVKLAADEAGHAALDAEAGNLSRFGPVLRAPLRAPRLLHRGEGVLVTEAVRWRSRAPSQLDPVVAHRLGLLWASGSTADHGPAHGDFAAWNLLPVAGGWVLVDWEMARADAPPFFDLLHWLVAGHVHLRRPSWRTLEEALRGRGAYAAAVRAYADGAALDPSSLAAAVAGYLDATSVDAATPAGAKELPVRRRLRDIAA